MDDESSMHVVDCIEKKKEKEKRKYAWCGVKPRNYWEIEEECVSANIGFH